MLIKIRYLKSAWLPACNASSDIPGLVIVCCSSWATGFKSSYWQEKGKVGSCQEDQGCGYRPQIFVIVWSVRVLTSCGHHLEEDEGVECHHCTEIDDMVEEGTNIGALACDVIIVTSIGTASPQKFTCNLKNLGVKYFTEKFFKHTPIISEAKRTLYHTFFWCMEWQLRSVGFQILLKRVDESLKLDLKSYQVQQWQPDLLPWWCQHHPPLSCLHSSDSLSIQFCSNDWCKGVWYWSRMPSLSVRGDMLLLLHSTKSFSLNFLN